jgi:tetratricopeptide (TPR) repeat protein
MYLSQTNESVGEYLDAYETCWHELSDNAGELLEYENRTLFSTWSLSLAQVRARDPDAAELLRLLAYFGSQGIHYELFQSAKDCGLPWLSALVEHKRRFQRAMALLQDYSLVEVSASGYNLHSRVHDWTLHALNREASGQYFWVAVHCIASKVCDDSERDYWKINRLLVEHAIRFEHSLFSGFLNVEDLNESCFLDLHHLGVLWYGLGHYFIAEKLFQRALSGEEREVGPAHVSTLETVSRLGHIYRDQDKMSEAGQMFQRGLRDCEKALGPDHRLTLEMIHGLGYVYYRQGKWLKAQQMYDRALKGTEKVFGPEHFKTLGVVHDLGHIYRRQGKEAEAEQMYQRALTGCEKGLGPDHPDTLQTVPDLGDLYHEQDKITEAERMYQRAFIGYEKALGLDHLYTIDTSNRLACF